MEKHLESTAHKSRTAGPHLSRRNFVAGSIGFLLGGCSHKHDQSEPDRTPPPKKTNDREEHRIYFANEENVWDAGWRIRRWILRLAHSFVCEPSVEQVVAQTQILNGCQRTRRRVRHSSGNFITYELEGYAQPDDAQAAITCTITLYPCNPSSPNGDAGLMWFKGTDHTVPQRFDIA